MDVLTEVFIYNRLLTLIWLIQGLSLVYHTASWSYASSEYRATHKSTTKVSYISTPTYCVVIIAEIKLIYCSQKQLNIQNTSKFCRGPSDTCSIWSSDVTVCTARSKCNCPQIPSTPLQSTMHYDLNVHTFLTVKNYPSISQSSLTITYPSCCAVSFDEESIVCPRSHSGSFCCQQYK